MARPDPPADSRSPLRTGRPPAYLTGLVGRETEAACVRALVLDPGTRIVTLTGPGGVGKTRLAVQVATNLDTAGDVAFVDFAPVRDPDRVADRIAEALGVEEPLAVGTRRHAPFWEDADRFNAELLDFARSC